MNAKQKAELAILKIEEQMNDLTSITNRGSASEVSDKIDRWVLRTRKAIELSINAEEAEKFRNYRPSFIHYDLYEAVSAKIEFYQKSLRVLKDELANYPDSLFDPGSLVVEATIPTTELFALLHSQIVKVSREQFDDEYYSDAVFSAYKELNNRVKNFMRQTRDVELDGRNLMLKAISDTDPLILMGDLKTETGRNMQEGYRFIFSGAIQAIRNPKAHDHVSIDKKRAIHLLFLASLLMYKCDDANVPIS
jgi:uncharacterized protein (TIGR02391 family)